MADDTRQDDQKAASSESADKGTGHVSLVATPLVVKKPVPGKAGD